MRCRLVLKARRADKIGVEIKEDVETRVRMCDRKQHMKEERLMTVVVLLAPRGGSTRRLKLLGKQANYHGFSFRGWFPFDKP
jgi:hypothetical protein